MGIVNHKMTVRSINSCDEEGFLGFDVAVSRNEPTSGATPPHVHDISLGVGGSLLNCMQQSQLINSLMLIPLETKILVSKELLVAEEPKALRERLPACVCYYTWN